MTADIIKIYERAPVPDIEVARDLADLLDGGRCDPSDDDACLDHLFNLGQYRPSVVFRNFPAAMYEYGQRLISREMSRQQAAE